MRTTRVVRLYADTSVFGGCYDEEFADESLALMQEIRQGRFLLLFSTTTARELRLAPPRVRELIPTLPPDHIETLDVSAEVEELRDAYLQAGVVGASSLLDAEHIACASVARADLIVSWNFKHIVHFDKIRGYHSVNVMNGYPTIPIHSPKEVIQW